MSRCDTGEVIILKYGGSAIQFATLFTKKNYKSSDLHKYPPPPPTNPHQRSCNQLKGVCVKLKCHMDAIIVSTPESVRDVPKQHHRGDEGATGRNEDRSHVDYHSDFPINCFTIYQMFSLTL